VAKVLVYITKGKTLRTITLDEGAVGKSYCVLVTGWVPGG